MDWWSRILQQWSLRADVAMVGCFRIAIMAMVEACGMPPLPGGLGCCNHG